MKKVLSDIEIAEARNNLPFAEIAANLEIPPGNLIAYGHDKAKIGYDFLQRLCRRAKSLALPGCRRLPTAAFFGHTRQFFERSD